MAEKQTIVDAISDEKTPALSKHPDVRIAVIGNVDSGKSTLIGVLTSGELDDGRGAARSRIFVHQHEAVTGRTSCIAQHILGFDENKSPVHVKGGVLTAAQRTKAWRDVVTKSASTVTLIDLAGHERYLKTTIAGLTGCFPDYAIAVVGANAGVTKMTKEHLGVAIALEIPVMVVVTKIDMTPPNVLEETKKQLNAILRTKGAHKTPFFVHNETDVVTCLSNSSPKLCPIFLISSVKGTNIDFLLHYLSQLSPQKHWVNDANTNTPEFLIDESFVVPGVGLVISGTVSAGVLHHNTTMLLGPAGDGSFQKVLVKSMHCKRTPVELVSAGDSCAVALKSLKPKHQLKRSDIRRGMVLLDQSVKPQCCLRFEAQVMILHHPTTIKPNYQAVIHCGIIRQTATLTTMSLECLRTGDKAIVEFEYIKRPEFMHPGKLFIFREGTTKGIGKVVRLFDIEPIPDEKTE